MDYGLIAHEAERSNCFSITILDGQKMNEIYKYLNVFIAKNTQKQGPRRRGVRGPPAEKLIINEIKKK